MKMWKVFHVRSRENYGKFLHLQCGNIFTSFPSHFLHESNTQLTTHLNSLSPELYVSTEYRESIRKTIYAKRWKVFFYLPFLIFYYIYASYHARKKSFYILFLSIFRYFSRVRLCTQIVCKSKGKIHVVKGKWKYSRDEEKKSNENTKNFSMNFEFFTTAAKRGKWREFSATTWFNFHIFFHFTLILGTNPLSYFPMFSP